MNTFALLLLAFPIYATVKGRLNAYVSLATTANTSTAETSGTVTQGGVSQSTLGTEPLGGSL
jgi:hypothetical protein